MRAMLSVAVKQDKKTQQTGLVYDLKPQSKPKGKTCQRSTIII
jgi:hypothetical protein